MTLTIWFNNTIASLALMAQGDLTCRRDQGCTLQLSRQCQSQKAHPLFGTDLGCNTELRAAALENVLARLA